MKKDETKSNDTMRAEIKKSYPQLFQGNGTLPGVHTIVLKNGATGIIHAPRRVAVSKRPQLKQELDRQVDLGFLAKVNEPTDWVNSLVIAEKSNGKMRLCIDPKDLNKEIKREHFQIPTKEEIIGKLANATCFSKLDATAGFHQIQLDRPSSLLTTFNTPFGRYRYLRLPMGICSAPEVFHKTVHQFLEDIEVVSVYMDDIIVWGSTAAEHDELGRYIPNLSARTAPLRLLLEKDSDWQWQHEHELAWNGIKGTLSKHPVLQYYDESKSLKVSSDASKDGIGAVLLQETNGEWMWRTLRGP